MIILLIPHQQTHGIYIVSDSIVIVAYLVCRRYCNRCVAVSVICVSPFWRVAVLTSYQTAEHGEAHGGALPDR